MKTRPTKNQIELSELLAERDSYRCIDGLHRLDMDGVSRLLRLGHEIFACMAEFRAWFLGVLRQEVRIRTSDGAIERGRYVFPADSFSDKELMEIGMAVDSFRDVAVLSDAERDVIVSLHRQVQKCINIRLLNTAENSVRLLDAKEVCDLLGIPRASLKRLIDSGKLPKPIAVLPKVHRWRHDRVQAALEDMN